MSTATEISRLQSARNTIRNKLITFGLAVSTDKLDDLATAIDGISYQGAVTATVQEGDTYTIPAGYHTGSGTVSGVSGGGNYTLQSKTVTPTKSQQTVTPDNGKYGLSDVTVNAIPEAYQDTSSVTATASDVLATKVIVTANGTVTAGTMTNNGAVSKVLDATTNNQTYTVPTGYHNGSGTVRIVLEQKTATPTENTQTITPTTGKVLSQVTVNPIPGDYVDVSDADGVAANVLSGVKVYSYDSTNNEPVAITGSMTSVGAVSASLDTSVTSYTVPAGYHNGNGTVTIDLEEKSVTPTTSSQNITPTSGQVLSKVTVNAIPAKFGDTTGDDAVAANLLAGKFAHTIVSGTATQIEGTMANNGAISGSIDGLTTTSYSVAAGYTSGGSVSLTNDIEQALAAI